jgi:hypothetical protein
VFTLACRWRLWYRFFEEGLKSPKGQLWPGTRAPYPCQGKARLPGHKGVWTPPHTSNPPLDTQGYPSPPDHQSTETSMQPLVYVFDIQSPQIGSGGPLGRLPSPPGWPGRHWGLACPSSCVCTELLYPSRSVPAEPGSGAPPPWLRGSFPRSQQPCVSCL